MAGIFQRLFKVGQAESHSFLDRLEDPIKLSEQAVRDLKNDLQESLRSLAEVKAIGIRMAKDAEDGKQLAGDYERKALLLLQKAQSGELVQTEAERLAREALARQEESVARARQSAQQAQVQHEMAAKLQNNINDLKSKMTAYESELLMLKARSKTANATRKINERLANLDSQGTVSLLERMKQKTDEQEALAEAYGDLAESSRSIDEEIDKALAGTSSPQVEDSLAQLKARVGAPQGKPTGGQA